MTEPIDLAARRALIPAISDDPLPWGFDEVRREYYDGEGRPVVITHRTLAPYVVAAVNDYAALLGAMEEIKRIAEIWETDGMVPASRIAAILAIVRRTVK